MTLSALGIFRGNEALRKSVPSPFPFSGSLRKGAEETEFHLLP